MVLAAVFVVTVRREPNQGGNENIPDNAPENLKSPKDVVLMTGDLPAGFSLNSDEYLAPPLPFGAVGYARWWITPSNTWDVGSIAYRMPSTENANLLLEYNRRTIVENGQYVEAPALGDESFLVVLYYPEGGIYIQEYWFRRGLFVCGVSGSGTFDVFYYASIMADRI